MIDSTRICGRERATRQTVGIVPAPSVVYWGGPNLHVNLASRCSSDCTFCLADLAAAAAVAADLGAAFRVRRLVSPGAARPEGPS
jgi:hypothetical protein